MKLADGDGDGHVTLVEYERSIIRALKKQGIKIYEDWSPEMNKEVKYFVIMYAVWLLYIFFHQWINFWKSIDKRIVTNLSCIW